MIKSMGSTLALWTLIINPRPLPNEVLYVAKDAEKDEANFEGVKKTKIITMFKMILSGKVWCLISSFNNSNDV